jgi:DNA-binding PadR family transcriptional regulator
MHGPSSLEAALLGLLARGAASGYELRKVFQTTPLATYSDSPGAVYPALRRLETRGLVTRREARGGRRRSDLRLTAKGRVWIRRWAAAPVTTADVMRDAAAVDLRLALLSNIDPVRIPGFLTEYADALESHLESLTAAAVKLTDLPPSAALSLNLGIHLFRARLAWMRRAAREHRK